MTQTRTREPLVGTALLCPFGLVPQFPGMLYSNEPDQNILCWPLPASTLPSTSNIGFMLIETTTSEQAHTYELVALDIDAQSVGTLLLQVKGELYPILYRKRLADEIQEAMNLAEALLRCFQLLKY